MAVRKKVEAARKKCGSCGRTRVIGKFRQLKSGYRQTLCIDCEREAEKERWHRRSAASKANSGGTAARRRERERAGGATKKRQTKRAA